MTCTDDFIGTIDAALNRGLSEHFGLGLARREGFGLVQPPPDAKIVGDCEGFGEQALGLSEEEDEEKEEEEQALGLSEEEDEQQQQQQQALRLSEEEDEQEDLAVLLHVYHRFVVARRALVGWKRSVLVAVRERRRAAVRAQVSAVMARDFEEFASGAAGPVEETVARLTAVFTSATRDCGSGGIA